MTPKQKNEENNNNNNVIPRSTSTVSSSTTTTTTTTTTSSSNENEKDLDNHELHVWCIEPQDNNNNSKPHGVLTVDGLNQIAHHKYVGGTYTALDTVLSPNLWEPLTEKLLPMWLAPNLVTTLGGSFCLTSFLVATYFLNLYETTGIEPPRWVYFFNGSCHAIYYTLDCMDGKQARRTQSSSPLGQLFDHGMDCLCNLSHLRVIQCIVLLPHSSMVIMQASLQFSFWQAQWDEYYTGVLPHAAGDFGVTELNYGMAAWSIVTGIFGREIYDKVVISSGDGNDGEEDWQVRHILQVAWITMLAIVMTQSWFRVYKHVGGTVKAFAPAFAKWISPALLFALATADGRLSSGLCYCLITIKIIIYSMARMAYASIQLDIIPYCAVVLVDKYILDDDNVLPSEVYTILDIYYVCRLSYWIHCAIHQLCERLQIPLFRIKPKKKEA